MIIYICLPDSSEREKFSGYILLAGGEIDYGSSVSRLVDYWILDLSTFTWQQIPAQMPIPLIEPRLTATNSGKCRIFLAYAVYWAPFLAGFIS